MSAVLKALIEQWVVPRMNARRLHPSVFPDNTGSSRVFIKNGFTLWKTVPKAVSVPEKGEFPAEKRTIEVYEYNPERH
jgi:RimJ/RimL family protein N-acetyltransferase